MEPLSLSDRGSQDLPSNEDRTRLNGQTSPEMLYLETKWASLIPFARVVDLLKDVLHYQLRIQSMRRPSRAHLHTTAERIEQELGEERQLNLFEGSEENGEQQALPDGPMTVGLDGGYVRAAHKEGCFEMIAGRSVVAFSTSRERGSSAGKVLLIRPDVRPENHAVDCGS